ncbi:hypothetical protein MTOK_38410 [Mycolicibacterium tokaiense]|nr:hypothetical protein MTOK_38410 [Mycolicibacterium tokaiense]
MEMACDERREFADFLAGLAPEQWNVRSLCSRWRVRDVVAHTIGYDELSAADLAARFVRGRFLVNRINAIRTGELAAHPPEELVQMVRDHIRPRGLTAAFGGMIALVDGTIHQQDIRRPLNMPRTIPACTGSQARCHRLRVVTWKWAGSSWGRRSASDGDGRPQ